MNWVERRDANYVGIPELWDRLCIRMEQAADSYQTTTFARERSGSATPDRVRNCLHITKGRFGQPDGSLDICLDTATRRVFSRIPGEQEQRSLPILEGPDGRPFFQSSEGAPMGLDEVSRYFLESFLFG